MSWMHCWRLLAGTAVALALAACGGEPGDSAAGSVFDGAQAGTAGPAADLPTSKSASARFLSQASFGASEAEIPRLEALGYSRWIEDQFTRPAVTHLSYYAERTAMLGENQSPRTEWVYESFWKNPQHHESGPKTFLGATVSATTPEGSLKAALDHLFAHPNIGTFFGKQLIQLLVTSNPSQAYVARVAAAFADNGKGQRGDMKAIIRAVLLDPEARDDARADDPSWGKFREPILRVTAWMRAFKATSTSGFFMIPRTDDVVSSIGQSPMRAPSVFNWFRPGYVPPNTTIASAGMVAPEMQITRESSVAGYLNTMRSAVQSGFGSNDPATSKRDVQLDYSAEFTLA